MKAEDARSQLRKIAEEKYYKRAKTKIQDAVNNGRSWCTVVIEDNFVRRIVYNMLEKEGYSVKMQGTIITIRWA